MIAGGSCEGRKADARRMVESESADDPEANDGEVVQEVRPAVAVKSLKR